MEKIFIDSSYQDHETLSFNHPLPDAPSPCVKGVLSDAEALAQAGYAQAGRRLSEKYPCPFGQNLMQYPGLERRALE
jgi:hypothetical protein